MKKSIIIIGAGLSGLSAGCYGQMNGYSTRVFEMHDKAGGVCTGWKRKGYTIDGAMNWLMGTKPGSAFHNIWEELGAAQNWQIYNHNNYIIAEDKDGQRVTVPCQTDKLEILMTELYPEDRALIETFCQTVRRCSQLNMSLDKPQELYTPVDYIKLIKELPVLSFIRKWGKTTLKEYADQFQSPLLKKIFGMSNEEGMHEMPAFTIPMLFSFLQNREAGYVTGGALALVSSIKNRYLNLGGELILNSRVDRIVVENNRAAGIILSDGTVHKADYIVSTADGHTTIFHMLEEKYINRKIHRYYNNLKLFPPLIYIGLGVNRNFDDIPAALNGLLIPLEKPVSIAGRERKDLSVLVYNFDPTLAPENCTVLIVPIKTEYRFWQELYQNREQYKAEKERIADTVITLLDKTFPGLTSQIEVRDIATPMTWVRYTGNREGSYEGWMITPDTFMMHMKKTLPGLKNFYMAGQWVNPGGGMSTAVMSGNHTIQLICHKDRKKFLTEKP